MLTRFLVRSDQIYGEISNLLRITAYCMVNRCNSFLVLTYWRIIESCIYEGQSPFHGSNPDAFISGRNYVIDFILKEQKFSYRNASRKWWLPTSADGPIAPRWFPDLQKVITINAGNLRPFDRWKQDKRLRVFIKMMLRVWEQHRALKVPL